MRHSINHPSAVLPTIMSEFQSRAGKIPTRPILSVTLKKFISLRFTLPSVQLNLSADKGLASTAWELPEPKI
jgi:hypothetical protein